MERTLKFQLSNVKKTFLFGALISYVGVALFLIFAYSFDPSGVIDIGALPIWLQLLSAGIVPFTFMATLYALWDGLMYFDSAIRFGIPRHTYFITQLIIHFILALLMAFATGVTEVPWLGSTSLYFKTLGENYLSFVPIMSEFTEVLSLAVLMLAIYRFKAKVFIPIAIVFGIFTMTISYTVIADSEPIFGLLFKFAEMVMNNKEIFASLLAAIVIGIYYLFVTKTEVQD